MNSVKKGFLSISSFLVLVLVANTAFGQSVEESIITQLAQIRENGEFDNSRLTNRIERLDNSNGSATDLSDAPAPFIIGGRNASRSAFREYALVIIIDGAGEVTGLCGGTLIAANKILTAAHCAQERAANYFVIPGFYSFDDQIRPRDLFRVRSVVDHPSYRPQNLGFDVAVITLAGNAAISPASVARGSSRFTGQRGTVIGTGLVATSPTVRGPNVLQQVAAPIISNGLCSANYSRFTGTDPITSNMICAGFTSNGNGTCSGDSGGPLFVNVNGRRTIVGVVSFGFLTCENNRETNVYARATSFTSFIRSQSSQTRFVESSGGGNASLAPVYGLLFGEDEELEELEPL